MKRLIAWLNIYVVTLTMVIAGAFMPHASAAFNQNLIMDDTVFSDTNSMSAASIDSWLNANFPSSCISTHNGFYSPDPTGYTPSLGFTYGGNVSAGRVISDSAKAYGLNPQVILATLQKESSVVSGDASYHCAYINTAMGYGCPDSGSCPTDPATMSGFSKQVIHAAWLMKFGEQRSLGNTGWDVQYTNYPQVGDRWDNSDDPPTCYGGPMTQGNLSRGCSQPATFYDGYTTIDNTAVHMDTGATATLYWYTPHFHGNQLFYNNFTAWFGGTISANYYSCHNTSNIAGAATGPEVVPLDSGNNVAQVNVLSMQNNTGSHCVEFHGWTSNYQSWAAHIASNNNVINPANSEIVKADTTGNGIDELFLVQYRSTSSGKVELHEWDRTGQHWLAHIATNLPAIDPANGRVIAGDFNGDGRDEFAYVKYQGTSGGKLEIHIWSSNLQGWTAHIATALPTVSPANARVVAYNFNGGDRDEFAYVKYQGTGSGKLEVHVWAPGAQGWWAHIATSMPTMSSATNTVVPVKLSTGKQDTLEVVEFSNTASGKVEIHKWAPNLQGWVLHVATAQPEF
jgi:hypothetical protein